jgi:hypothetical protein
LPRPSRRGFVAAGLGLAAAVVAAFVLLGSSSNPTVDPIARAATVSSHAPGFRMHMSVSLSSSAFGGSITAYGDAVIDPRDHAGSMSFVMDLSSVPQAAEVLGGGTLRLDMIMNGQDIYVRIPQALLAAMPSLAGRPWFKMNLTKAVGVPGLSSLGNDPTTSDPRQILQYLSAGSDGVTNEGQQRVDGLPTTHYHAQLSLDHLTAGLPSAEQATVSQALAKLRQTTGSSDLPIDVWVDAHQFVRRIAMSLGLHLPGSQSLQETVVADLTDYGPQRRPTLPPADQVQDATSLLSSGGLSG